MQPHSEEQKNLPLILMQFPNIDHVFLKIRRHLQNLTIKCIVQGDLRTRTCSPRTRSILRSVPTAPHNLSLPPSYKMCISCSPVPLRRLRQASLEEEVRDTRCRLHWAILSFQASEARALPNKPSTRWLAGAPKRELLRGCGTGALA
jgi:hypothetical protein